MGTCQNDGVAAARGTVIAVYYIHITANSIPITLGVPDEIF